MCLPVLADPFWGRLPWLLSAGAKHSKQRVAGSERGALVRVRLDVDPILTTF
jgi:hypothetical protein